jgi:formamidopyrimidine-DNA glycosylase
MPELPEVETVKETLKLKVLNKKIKNVKVLYSNIIEYPASDIFIKELIGQTINDIKRRGKWLLFELDNYYLLSHLRMEGKYNIRNPKDSYDKHEHVCFEFTDNTELRYKDTRKFGRMHLICKDDLYTSKPLNELGLEPWDELLTVEYLKDKYKSKKNPIKTVILDQSIIVGIGNIYADEILFLSNINPFTKASELDGESLQKIIDNTRRVLTDAIKMGGTTIRTYTSSEGVHGRFQQNLLVHNHEGDLCPVCKNIIVKVQINGRGTYYCEKCQNN